MAVIPPCSPCNCQVQMSLDLSIRETLKTLEQDFFTSIPGNDAALMSFNQSWSSFTSALESSHEQLSQQTLAMVFSFAEVVESITASMIDFHDESKVVLDTITAEVSQVFAGLSALSLEDTQPTEHIMEDTSSSRPSYIADAYNWLLSNLHNPYPSKEVRSQIAASHHASRKMVDGWFIDARKRIGWNSLCKAHFKSRKDVVDAATAFFSGVPIPSGSSQPFDGSGADLGGVFVALENRAKTLYSNKLAATPDSDSEISRRGRKSPDRSADGRPSKRKRQDARSAYPSPPASIQGSPDPVAPSRDTSQERENSIGPFALPGVPVYLPPFPASTLHQQSLSTVVTSRVTSQISQPLSSKRKRNNSCAEPEVPVSKRARRTVSATAPQDFGLAPALELWPSPAQVESFDFSVDTPPAVEAIPLAENIEWDTSNFEQLIATLQREDTPELSEAGSSPYSATSPGLANSPEFLPNLDFTAYHDPSNTALLSVEAEPLIFYNSYNNTPDASTDLFSTLLQPSGQYDMSLAPLDIMPNSWLSSLDQDNLNTWSLQPTDKELSSFGSQANFFQPTTTTHDDRMVKLLRAQQLREELRKLEQDIQA